MCPADKPYKCKEECIANKTSCNTNKCDSNKLFPYKDGSCVAKSAECKGKCGPNTVLCPDSGCATKYADCKVLNSCPVS